VKVPLHSTVAESGRPAVFIGQILPVFSLFSPCSAGPAAVSLPSRTFTTGC
jgi:hypothetical protein